MGCGASDETGERIRIEGVDELLSEKQFEAHREAERSRLAQQLEDELIEGTTAEEVSWVFF